MLIFDKKDINSITDFTLKTYFRHYSLYEFAFKPRMELFLRAEPFLNNKFNAEICKLDQMEEVDQAEAEKYKAHLGMMD